jgi:ABC-type branched-subunit amino acid transport system permease subunit
MRAVRDDEDAAAQVGVRAFRVKLGTFMVASPLMSAAGALQAYKLTAVEPYGMFDNIAAQMLLPVCARARESNRITQ